MKWLQLVFAILFLLFAGVQYNDPDALPWVVLYLVIAGLFTFNFFGKGHRMLSLGLLALIVVLAVIHAPGAWEFLFNDDGVKFSEGMSNEHPYIEKAREFGGLVIGGLSVFFLYRQQQN